MPNDKDFSQFIEAICGDDDLRSRFSVQIRSVDVDDSKLEAFFNGEGYAGVTKAQRMKIIHAAKGWGQEGAGDVVLQY